MCSSDPPSTSLGSSSASRVTPGSPPRKARSGPASLLNGSGGKCDTVRRADDIKTFLVNYCRSDSTRAQDGEKKTPPPPLMAVHIQFLQA